MPHYFARDDSNSSIIHAAKAAELSMAHSSGPQSSASSAGRRQRPTGFSAYLSIFNDWDILGSTLASIAGMVDELVVVDGAYKWMAPYVEATGGTPARSDERVYQIIESAGIPFRTIADTWNSEAEKRIAGYEACRNRFVCRVDADEIIFPDFDRIEAFLRQGAPAAEMEAPLYISPGRVLVTGDGRRPRAGFLFDSKQIAAADHLQYLWLVSGQPRADTRPRQVFPEAVAFNAHLAHWRTPATAIGRAAFYALDYVRKVGAPWFSDLRSRPLADLAILFNRIPPPTFRDSLMGSRVVAGYGELHGLGIGPSPLGAADEQQFCFLFDAFLTSQARANHELAERGRYTLGRTYIDLSSLDVLTALSSGTAISLRFFEEFSQAKVYLQYLTTSEPWEDIREIEVRVEPFRLTFDIPRNPPEFLRRVLRLDIWFQGRDPAQRFVVER